MTDLYSNDNLAFLICAVGVFTLVETPHPALNLAMAAALAVLGGLAARNGFGETNTEIPDHE